jgi:hypothetical protein
VRVIFAPVLFRLSLDRRCIWPAPGSEDTELGVLMEPEVGHVSRPRHKGEHHVVGVLIDPPSPFDTLHPKGACSLRTDRRSAF